MILGAVLPLSIEEVEDKGGVLIAGWLQNSPVPPSSDLDNECLAAGFKSPALLSFRWRAVEDKPFGGKPLGSIKPPLPGGRPWFHPTQKTLARAASV